MATIDTTTPKVSTSPLDFAQLESACNDLRIFATSFNDVQQTRIVLGNRARAMLRDYESLSATDLEALIASLEKLEDDWAKGMRNSFRRVSPVLVQWQKDTHGIGEHLLARLIGEIGHPCIALPSHWEKDKVSGEKKTLVRDDPYLRSVGQLWAFCGHGDPTLKLRPKMTQDELFARGRPAAKMLVRLMSESCVKLDGKKGGRRSPYRDVYDISRVKYNARSHESECVRCGPSGKPAQPGTPWSPGHAHAAALRKTGKEILKDMWRACEEEAVKAFA